MLRLLRIRNFALIKELEIEFGHGLNLLTGETGSGKSILVDSFGLLLGNRSSQEMIRTNSDSAVIEGMFEIQREDPVLGILADAGFEDEENILLIRREISSVGKNRIFINGHLATLNLLKMLGENLADIHGQQDQKSLLDLSTHLEWLDYFGDNDGLVQEVGSRFKSLQETSQLLGRFEAEKQETLHRMDMLEFQLDEIKRVDPLPNEIEELEKERAILSNSERILELSTGIYASIYENETSFLAGMRRLEHLIEELQRYDESWAQHREALEECMYRLEDIAMASRDYASRCDFNPDRLEKVQNRLFSLEKLVKKYCTTGVDLLEFADECRRELETLKSSTGTAEELSKRFESEMHQYRQVALKLSNKRHEDAVKLEKSIKKEFAALAMPGMKLRVRFHDTNTDTGNAGIPRAYGLRGIDRVEFFIAPNAGEDMRPLAKIASGGELSRLMLAIKSLCGKENTGKSLVFDEVDSGIGGRIAEAVGKRLQKLSQTNQVFCVTHLPQVAAFAHNHFSVSKSLLDDRTETRVSALNSNDRIQEISRMLGGEVITETTRRHAREMLESSEEFGREDKDPL
ncbi:MAG: DNA repair protein RecN [Acidobacteriota bacterium]